MKVTGIIALLFASTAVACKNGPYKTGSLCPTNCADAQRCGDGNHVIKCVGGRWVETKSCKKCKFGACK